MRWRARALALAVALMPVAGCGGGGTVHAIPLMRSDLPAPEPLIHSVPVTEAYYWVDKGGTLNVGLRYHARSLLGKMFDAEWLMSIQVKGLPAGSEQLYHLGGRAIRMMQSQGGAHYRGCSLMGIAVIHAPRAGRLNGRFHAWVQQQRFSLLTGWSPPLNRAPRLIMVGRFQAVRDAVKGGQILLRTQGDGLDRSLPPPTTGPAQSQSAGPATGPGS